MYCKEITYEDYNGETRTEKFYFNINKMELRELQFGRDEGLDEYLKSLRQSDMGTILAVFKEIVLLSFGIKSEDGKRFMKSEDISESFEESPAYDVLMDELLYDEKAAEGFMSKILPKLSEAEKKQLEAIKKEEEKTNIENG